MKSVVDSIKKFDTFHKTIEDAQLRTLSGATISLLSFALIIVLVFLEFKAFLTPNLQEELFVDTTRGQKLRINFDFFVPAISCDYLSLDAMDSSGETHMQIDHNIFKRRMDLQGNPISEAKKEEIATSTKRENATAAAPAAPPVVTEANACGSCYGAQVNATHCCNTCQDVIDAYREKKWNPNIEDFIQCQAEQREDKAKQGYALKEACQMFGTMEVNRVSGSFHLAPGKSFSISHVHVHDVQPFSSYSFNTSHVINHLSFGDQIGEQFGTTHPLNGYRATAAEGGYMFQYYIKIVPTMYVSRNKSIIHTNQFSVTTYRKSVATSRSEGMPGIFFSYELSPLMVKITEKSNSLGHFLTNVCSIVGGIYVVASMIDAFLHSSIKKIKKIA